jgi:hypothetical protein
MRSIIHLYPDNQAEQRLRLSYSLKDIHYEAGFREAVGPFGVEIIEVPREEQLVSESWQELKVRPPLLKERVAEFGQALIGLAHEAGMRSLDSIIFLDHTEDTPLPSDGIDWSSVIMQKVS